MNNCASANGDILLYRFLVTPSHYSVHTQADLIRGVPLNTGHWSLVKLTGIDICLMASNAFISALGWVILHVQ